MQEMSWIWTFHQYLAICFNKCWWYLSLVCLALSWDFLQFLNDYQKLSFRWHVFNEGGISKSVVLLPEISSKEIFNKEIVHIKHPCTHKCPVGVNTLLVLPYSLAYKQARLTLEQEHKQAWNRAVKLQDEKMTFLGTSSPDSLQPDCFALRCSHGWLKGERAHRLNTTLLNIQRIISSCVFLCLTLEEQGVMMLEQKDIMTI